MGQEGGFIAERGDFRGFSGWSRERVLGRVGSSAVGQGQLRNVPRGTWQVGRRCSTPLLEMFLVEHDHSDDTDDPPGRAGRWFAWLGVAGYGCVSPETGHQRGVLRTPRFKARNFRVRLGVMDVYRNLDFDGIGGKVEIRS